jgi:hypothetical protein
VDEMDVELDPEQPPAVAEALAALLREERRPVDPWWQAGIEDALGT